MLDMRFERAKLLKLLGKIEGLERLERLLLQG